MFRNHGPHAHALHAQTPRDQTGPRGKFDLFSQCGLLFPSRTGTPISPRNLARQFKELLTKAGLPTTIRFHDLRHTAGSTALAHGMDVKSAQRMLGHAQATTTLDIYGHPLEELQEITVSDAVNKAFRWVDEQAITD